MTTPTPDVVTASGGLCVPSSFGDLFKPREIPGTTAELTLSWDGNVTAARERAELYRSNGRRLRGHRADLDLATMVRNPQHRHRPGVGAGRGGAVVRGDDPRWGCVEPGCDAHPANPRNGGPIYRLSPKGQPFVGACGKHYAKHDAPVAEVER